MTKMLDHTQYADWIITEAKKASPKLAASIHKLANNKFTIAMDVGGHTLRYRVVLFAVGAAGRSNPLERRVEITSTYSGSLKPLAGHVDVVLGVEREKRLLVGIDSRRLDHGGPTHNASTFVYLPSFEKLAAGGWFSMQTASQLFSNEYQIYFEPQFLLEYLRQHDGLHKSGLASLTGAKVEEDAVDSLDSFSANGSKTKLTYDQQVELALKKMQIGRVGESIALKAERTRLSEAGAVKLAQKVHWVSQEQPYLGYDISSFSNTAEAEFVEVKSSVSKVRAFYFTANEMKVAQNLGDSYRLLCVSNVMTQPTIREFRNPIEAIEKGILAVERDTQLVAIKS